MDIKLAVACAFAIMGGIYTLANFFFLMVIYTRLRNFVDKYEKDKED